MKGETARQRIIGYYQSWAYARQCNHVAPENIDPTVWTHIKWVTPIPQLHLFMKVFEACCVLTRIISSSQLCLCSDRPSHIPINADAQLR